MEARAMSAEARAPGAAEDPPLEIIVEFTGELADLTAVGFSPVTVSEHPGEGYKIAPGTVPVGRLQDLVAIDHVVEVSHPKQYRPLLDYSLPEIRANAVHNGNPARKGSGVVIGVIDSGIDWRHGDFIAADGQTSRIVGIWDQLLTPRAGETTGVGGLGVVYDQGQLNKGVQGTLRLRTFDTGIVKDKEDERSKGHGTHVAGIAAGDGSMATCCRGPNTYVGVAPLASIIMVRSNFSENNLISAIDFILNHPAAAGKPVVINMSLGGTIGPHDGTEKVELHINSRVTAQAGRAIVIAAGNSGDVTSEPCHAAATVPANTFVDVEFTTPDGLPGAALVDVWYARAGSLNARLTSPDKTVIGPANHGVDVGPLPANPSAAVRRRANVTLNSTINGNHGRDNNLVVIISKPADGSIPGESRRGTEVAAEVLAHRRRLIPPPPPKPPVAPVAYEAMNSIADYWIPFLPVHVPGSNRSIQLQRAAMPSEIDQQPVRPRTSILREGLDSTPKAAYFINEEEVPQTGTRITVAYNRTRWRNGRAIVWLSTKRNTGRGEGSSGLAFDHLVDTPAAAQ
jgi:hypothetical protein